MPRNLEATLARAKWVWRYRRTSYVSFPDLRRAFKALAKLTEQGHAAEYDGQSGSRYWIRFFND